MKFNEETAKTIENTAKVVEGRLTFLQRFLNKKYGPEILFVVLVGLGVASSWFFNDKGRDQGKIDAYQVYESQIVSLKRDSANFQKVIEKQDSELTLIKSKLDTCKSDNSIEKMNKKVLNAIDEAERVKAILKEKLYNDRQFNSNINSILKSK